MKNVILLVLALCLTAQAKVAVSQETLSDKKDRYAIKIEYARVSLPGNPQAEAAINQALSKDAYNAADEFRADYAKEIKDLPKEVPDWSYDAGYSVAYESAQVLVIVVGGYDYRGGAHGMPVQDAMTFDLKTGKRLQLSDWYKDGYLKVFSDVSRAALMAKPDLKDDQEWIYRGTKPVAENFPVVYPTAKGMQIVFPPYQVAAYVFGPQEVLVPYSKLAPFAKAGTPVKP